MKRRAKHQPSGRIYDANNITTKSPLKKGPWVCEKQHCNISLNHRIATKRVSKNGAEPVFVNACFYAANDTDHLKECKYYDSTNKLPKTIINKKIPNNVNLLNIIPVNSNKNKANPQQATNSGKKSTPTPYGDILFSAEKLFYSIHAHAQNGNLTEQIYRMQGVDYNHAEFIFGPDYNSFQRLHAQISASSNKEGHKQHPWFVQGVIKYLPRLTADEKSWNIVLVSSPPQTTGKPKQINIFVPRFSPAAKNISELKVEQNMVVFATNPTILSGFGNVSFEIVSVNQFHLH